MLPNTFILKVPSGLVKLEGSVRGDVLYLPDLGVAEGSREAQGVHKEWG